MSEPPSSNPYRTPGAPLKHAPRRRRQAAAQRALARHLWRGWWVRRASGLVSLVALTTAVGTLTIPGIGFGVSVFVVSACAFIGVVLGVVFLLYRCPSCHQTFGLEIGEPAVPHLLTPNVCAHCGIRVGQPPPSSE